MCDRLQQSRNRCFALGVVLFFFPLLISIGATSIGQDPIEKIKLKVLYTGNPGSTRMLDFENLLRQYFEKVEVASFEKFKPIDAKPFDVVVFDWTSTYPRDENGKMLLDDKFEMKQPKPPALGSDFDRPAVMIGAMAGSLSHHQVMAIN